jgi:hypothetical protein
MASLDRLTSSLAAHVASYQGIQPKLPGTMGEPTGEPDPVRESSDPRGGCLRSSESTSKPHTAAHPYRLDEVLHPQTPSLVGVDGGLPSVQASCRSSLRMRLARADASSESPHLHGSS